MKLIDVNCMLGEWGHKSLRFKDPHELQKEMERLGIDKALVFSSGSWLNDIKSGNDFVVELSRKYAGLVPVIALTPLLDQEFGGSGNIAGFIRENRIGAVRLFPTDHNFSLELWSIKELFLLMEQLQLPVLLEGRALIEPIDSYYDQIYKIARRFKNVNIVLLSVGYRDLRIIYKLFDRCPNIHIDTSTFITFRGIEDIVGNFGSDRILFGTRMPFMEGGVSVGRLIYSDIKDEDKENIGYKNILRLMKSRDFPGSCKGDV